MRVMDPAKITVIIPAYNEEGEIREVLASVRSVSDRFEVIVVDDGSTDRTAEVAKSEGARVISHPYNMGNGAAIKTGVRAARGEILVLLDADNQHPPEEISRLLDEMVRYDMVVAARTGRSDESPVRRFGNWCMTRVARYLSEMPIADLTSGFRAIRRACMEEFLHLLPNRYSYPTTITLCMFRSGYGVKYVPLARARRRVRGRSHIQPIRDGLRFLIIILRMIMLFDPLKIFLPLSLGLIGVSLVLLGYHLVIFSRVKESFVVVAVIGCMTFLVGLLADQIALLRRERR